MGLVFLPRLCRPGSYGSNFIRKSWGEVINVKAFLGLLVGVIVIGLGWWFYRQSMTSPASPSPAITLPGSPAPSEENVKVFEVSGANFRFDPKTITVKKGDKVRIVFKP